MLKGYLERESHKRKMVKETVNRNKKQMQRRLFTSVIKRGTSENIVLS